MVSAGVMLLELKECRQDVRARRFAPATGKLWQAGLQFLIAPCPVPCLRERGVTQAARPDTQKQLGGVRR